MRIRIVAIGIVLLLSAAAFAAMQNGNDLYQQGLARETAGDIKGAIQIFERIVRDFSSNRTLTARTLLQLGRWSELVQQDQARVYYERVIREFANQPDQTDVVAQAKTRLQVLVPTTPPTAAPASMSVQPLADVTKGGELVAVSPDGSKGIVMDYSKGQNLALYDFAKKQTRLLTHLDWTTGWIYWAVWSPDARRVAYQQATAKNDASELRVTTLEGQSSVVYRSEGPSSLQPVGWTPDGATLVVVVRRPDRTWAVGTVPANGGRFTPLRSLGWSYDYRDSTPRLSPDGRLIAYLEGETGLRDVHVISLDGRNAYRITDDPADDLAPVWSPDNRHLAFTSTRLGTVSLWTVEVKEGKPVGQPVKLKDGMQSVRMIDWTEQGIFCEQQTRTWDVYTVPMDPIEGRPASSPRQIPYPRTGRNVSPVWSPDGGALAFVSSAASEPNRRYVVVMPADGGKAREFLIPTTSYEYPQTPADLRWFGDGRGLGFSARDTRGAPAVFRLLLETGKWDAIPLQAGEGRTETEWNSDGSAFYLVQKSSGNAEIFERAVVGDAERPVYRSSTPLINIRSLEFSPDRKWLAFQQWTFPTSDNTVTKRIVIVDVGTGETRTLLEAVSNASDSSAAHLVGWTPSGDLLIEYRGTGGASSETRIVPVNGRPPRSITIPTFSPVVPGETQQGLIAKWSPDGSLMVLGRVSRGWETFVIENPLVAVPATTVSR